MCTRTHTDSYSTQLPPPTLPQTAVEKSSPRRLILTDHRLPSIGPGIELMISYGGVQGGDMPEEDTTVLQAWLGEEKEGAKVGSKQALGNIFWIAGMML